MAAEKYGCFVKAKTACYSVFTRLKRKYKIYKHEGQLFEG